jgi:hypothetical protein
MRSRWIATLPYLVLIALALVIFRELAFTDRILGRGDTYVYFYPYWTVRDAFFRAGELPLWTPDIFMGAPLLANPQLGTLYPPNWLTIPFDAPNSIRISILLHITWAMLGAYLLARRAVRLDVGPSVVAAAIFGLGGYVGAHVEQINQLQGLSWFPWAFLLLHHSLERARHVSPLQTLHWTMLLGVVLALQFLAGHTQTVFICGVGMLVYLMAVGRPRGLLTMALAGVIALLLASPQLIPTLELIEQSGRSGGLSSNAALSFSLNPFIAARGLLPSYDGKIFSEYIAYVGVVGLFLSVIGSLVGTQHAVSLRTDSDQQSFPHRRVWIIIVIVALALAVGAYNPLNWLLVQLPGFDLFRVPARWLALYALGMAVLAGMGAQFLIQRNPVGATHVSPARRNIIHVAIPTGVIIILCGLSVLAGRVPEEINGPAIPTLRTLAGWGLALVAIGALIALRERAQSIASLQWAITGIVFIELIAASWIMPYNDLVPPDVWSSQRFTISQLLAYTETDENGLTADGTPPGRLLSISGLFFDPGDKDALSRRYQALGMTPIEERYSFVAAKLKETVSPNLPLAWGIPSVDGFGGGLLPTRHYVEFMELVYPEGVEVAVDGRLRENLALEGCRGACLPPDDSLTAMDIEYLLVDKVFDVWYEGVAFDTTFVVDNSQLEYVIDPPFMTNSVYVLFTCNNSDENCQIDSVRVTNTTGAWLEKRDGMSLLETQSLNDELQLLTASWPNVYGPWTKVQIETSQAQIMAVSMVNLQSDNQFIQLTPLGIDRILSSDIKLYDFGGRNLRAYVGRGLMHRTPTSENVTITSVGGDNVTFRTYHPTRIELDVTTDIEDAALVLADSYYPGWTATVNENPVPVYRANVNFRAIPLPTGTSQVIFEYAPWWYPGVLIVGGLLWGITGITILVSWRRQ